MQQPIEPAKRAWPVLEWFAIVASLVVIGFGLYFSYGLKFSGRPLPHGLQRPILAMEVPASSDEIRLILGCKVEKQKPDCRDQLAQQDISTMRLAQYVDWAFIPWYTALFLAAALIEWMTAGRGWRWLALVSASAVMVAAVFDYAEDKWILAALDRVASTLALNSEAIAQCGWTKWMLLFVALLGLLPLMFARAEMSMTFRIIARLMCALVGVSAMAGLVACTLRNPARLESAATAFAVVPFFFLLRKFLHRGTLAALNSLAKWWGLRVLARWPDFLFETHERLQTPAEGDREHIPAGPGGAV